MRVAVFGATGSVGRDVVERAIASGHDVHAFVRDSSADLPSGVTRTVGDLTDGESVSLAVAGCDAVIWAVGATQNAPDQVELFATGARHLTEAMTQHGVRRLVALSGAGITVDGERKPLGGRIMSAVVAIVVRHVVASKRREYEIFRDSGLDWTLVRPPRVIPGPPTDDWTAGARLAGRSVTSGALADFMVAQLTDTAYIRKAPYVSSTS